MDNREIFNYLSEDEKKRIAERIFEDELRKSFQSKYENTFKDIWHDFPTVYARVLDKYISDMKLIHEDFAPLFQLMV